MDFVYCNLSFRSAKSLTRTNWTNLMNLNLRILIYSSEYNKIGPLGVRNLVNRGKWPNLTMLNLCNLQPIFRKLQNRQWRDQSIVKKLFSKPTEAPYKYRRNDADNNNISDAGALFLFKFKNFFLMTCITLGIRLCEIERNPITRKVQKHIEKCVRNKWAKLIGGNCINISCYFNCFSSLHTNLFTKQSN